VDFMAIKKTNKRVVITLTSEEFEQLNKLTDFEQRSKTKVIKSALSDYFKKTNKIMKGTS
jgi:hypothetical protein